MQARGRALEAIKRYAGHPSPGREGVGTGRLTATRRGVELPCFRGQRRPCVLTLRLPLRMRRAVCVHESEPSERSKATLARGDNWPSFSGASLPPLPDQGTQFHATSRRLCSRPRPCTGARTGLSAAGFTSEPALGGSTSTFDRRYVSERRDVKARRTNTVTKPLRVPASRFGTSFAAGNK
jgi:hypothetical protein